MYYVYFSLHAVTETFDHKTYVKKYIYTSWRLISLDVSMWLTQTSKVSLHSLLSLRFVLAGGILRDHGRGLNRSGRLSLRKLIERWKYKEEYFLLLHQIHTVGFLFFVFFSEGIIYKVQPFLNNSYCDLTAMFHTGNVRDNFNTSFHNANVSISALNSVRILFSTWLKLHNIHIPCNKNEL